MHNNFEANSLAIYHVVITWVLGLRAKLKKRLNASNAFLRQGFPEPLLRIDDSVQNSQETNKYQL